MSLLLDALKKAAEKKAQKSGQPAADASTDSTEQLTQTEGIDATERDETHVETQRIEPTEFEDTHVETTRLDATEVDRTEVDEKAYTETQRIEPTEFEDTQVETARLDAGEPPADGGVLESDTTGFSAVDRDADPTKLIMDDSIPLDEQGNSLIETDDYTAEELARLREASRPELTEDDVTAFLGDGLADSAGQDIDATAATRTVEMPPLSLDDIRAREAGLDSDDTTLTHPEDRTALSMDDTTASGLPPGVEPRPPADEGGLDDDQSTVINPESHGAGIDLDRLTQEETLGDQTATGARTFAPDNYDRTLIKLSESDVSRIFPGMKAEPGAVMTPDYAKKVFMSKSSQHRGRYLKWMGIVGLVLLLVTGLWGLYDLSQQSERIDTSLARLKRDPMPGIIQPPKEEKIELFARSSSDATRAGSTASVEAVAESPAPTVPAAPAPDAAVATSSGEAASPEPQQQAKSPPTRDVGTEAPAAAKRKTRAAAAAVAPVAQTSPAAAARTDDRAPDLKISSSERIDDKDRMLNEAYAAYDRGDLGQARRLYGAVLEQEADNRDALLGMAAIEVQDGNYRRAIELYQKLLLLNPKDGEAMASLLAVANIDPQRGESQIKQMLSAEPDSPYLHFALGNMYSRQQRWAEAQSAYFRALQLNPDDPNTAYNLAVSMEHLGKPQVAREYYLRALANQDRSLAVFDAEQVAQRVEVLGQ